MPETNETRADAVVRWNERAERIGAQLRKDNPRAVVIVFRKRLVSQ